MIPSNHLLSFNRFYNNPGVDQKHRALPLSLRADYDGDTVTGYRIRMLNRRKKGPGKGKVKITQRLISYV